MRAAGVVAVLRVLCALVFTFLWMRRQDLGAGPATAGAFAYGLGGFVLLWVGWPLANPAALLPLVLYALALVRQRGERRDSFLLALGGFSLLLGGHPETVLYALAIAAAVLIAETWDTRRRSQELRLRRLRASLAALAIAGMVAAPVLLPTSSTSPRRCGRLAWSLLPQRRAARFPSAGCRSWLPTRSATAGSSTTGGSPTRTRMRRASWGRRRCWRRCWLSGRGGDSPGSPCSSAWPRSGLILLAVPVGSRRLLMPLALALAFLGACTLERLRRREPLRWPILLAVAVALGAVIAWGIVAHPHPDDPERLAVLRFGWLHWQMRFLVLATLLLGFTRGRWMPPVFAVLVAPELLLAHGPANPPMPARLALLVPPAVRFLQDNLGTGEQGRMAALDRAFPPNLPLLWEPPDARIYNPMAPNAWVEHTTPVTTGWWGELPEWGSRSTRSTPTRCPLHPDRARGDLASTAARGVRGRHRTDLGDPFPAPPSLPRPETGTLLTIPERETGTRLNRSGCARQLQSRTSGGWRPPSSRTATGMCSPMASSSCPRRRTALRRRLGCPPARAGWTWSTGRGRSCSAACWPPWDWRSERRRSPALQVPG